MDLKSVTLLWYVLGRRCLGRSPGSLSPHFDKFKGTSESNVEELTCLAFRAMILLDLYPTSEGISDSKRM
jgi:hypothetical protein